LLWWVVLLFLVWPFSLGWVGGFLCRGGGGGHLRLVALHCKGLY